MSVEESKLYTLMSRKVDEFEELINNFENTIFSPDELTSEQKSKLIRKKNMAEMARDVFWTEIDSAYPEIQRLGIRNGNMIVSRPEEESPAHRHIMMVGGFPMMGGFPEPDFEA